jgi:hypothetical protein
MTAPGWYGERRAWQGPSGLLSPGGEAELERWQPSRSQVLRGRGARSGWHAYRPAAAVSLPPWAVEVALTIERPLGRPPDHRGATPKGLLLLRSMSALQAMLLAVIGAMVEVEHVAGVGDLEPDLRLVRSRPVSGLEPLAAPIVLRHLRQASQRGVAAPPRRRASAGPAATWEAGAGAVATCRGPAGLSAQAVVALHGPGQPRSLQVPPGGAMVVRAWRLDRARRGGQAAAVGQPEATWALAAGVVVASGQAGGLGRVAGRLAASIRAEGLDASVPTGPAALELARAGDPHEPPPQTAARRVTGDEVIATLATCLATGMPA